MADRRLLAGPNLGERTEPREPARGLSRVRGGENVRIPRQRESAMSSGAGVAARQKVAQIIAEQSFDTRKFRALLAG